MNKTEDVYLAGAVALHTERDRVARAVAELRKHSNPEPPDLRGTLEELERARAACRHYLERDVPITLQKRILASLRAQGFEPER